MPGDQLETLRAGIRVVSRDAGLAMLRVHCTDEWPGSGHIDYVISPYLRRHVVFSNSTVFQLNFPFEINSHYYISIVYTIGKPLELHFSLHIA